MAGWFCAPNQTGLAFRRNITHVTTLACEFSRTQSDLSPRSNRRKDFSFLKYYHKLSD